MAGNSADAEELESIRRLASDLTTVRVTKTVQYDLLAHHLTKEEICAEIIAWIDDGNRVKKVTLRGQHAGAPAFEVKPRINDSICYVKMTIGDLDEPPEYLLLISAHPDH